MNSLLPYKAPSYLHTVQCHEILPCTCIAAIRFLFFFFLKGFLCLKKPKRFRRNNFPIESTNDSGNFVNTEKKMLPGEGAVFHFEKKTNRWPLLSRNVHRFFLCICWDTPSTNIVANCIELLKHKICFSIKIACLFYTYYWPKMLCISCCLLSITIGLSFWPLIYFYSAMISFA